MITEKRNLAQSGRFHAICNEVAHACPLIPYRRAFAVEAWKRFFLASYVHDARMEAYCHFRPDPFPVRPVPSSVLTSEQMSELIELACAWCAQNEIHLKK